MRKVVHYISHGYVQYIQTTRPTSLVQGQSFSKTTKRNTFPTHNLLRKKKAFSFDRSKRKNRFLTYRNHFVISPKALEWSGKKTYFGLR